MFEEGKLWKNRFGDGLKELSRYLRYILNGHIVIVLVFLFGMAAFYYQEWLKSVPEDFPAAAIMAVLLGVLLTYSPVYTFLTEADKIFLLPVENRLSGYFRRSLGVSWAVQAYLLLMGLGIFMPMYAVVNGGSFEPFLFFLIGSLAVKLLNLLIRWHVQYYVEKNTKMIDSVIRYCLNAAFLYLLFSNAGILFLLPVPAVLLVLWLYFRKQTEPKGLKWEYLIEQEERRMTSFYRLANLFTDVPKLKDRVKRRKWLDWLANRIPYGQDKLHAHLYMRTFIRSGDYFGLFIRLTVIGGAALYLISFGMGQILLVLLFLYLTGFQLLPLRNHHENKLWIQLYPLKEEWREKAFTSLLSAVLYLQTIIFSLVVLLKGDGLAALASAAAGAVFSWVFANIYSRRKLKN